MDDKLKKDEGTYFFDVSQVHLKLSYHFYKKLGAILNFIIDNLSRVKKD